MTDMDQELLNEFVVEAREQLEGVEPDLLSLDTTGGPIDSEVVNRIFRAVHSVKGAAGFFDLHVVNALAHAAESVLMPVRDGELMPDPDMVDLLLAANDRLRALVDDVHHSNEANVSSMVSDLEAWLAGRRGQATDGAAAAGAAADGAATDGPAGLGAGADDGAEEDPSQVVAEDARGDADVEDAAALGDVVPPPAAFGLPSVLHIDDVTRERLHRHGRRLYRIHVSVKEHVAGVGRTMSFLIDKFRKVGEVLACVQVGSGPPDSAEYHVWAATVLDVAMAPYGFDFPADRVVEVALDDAVSEAASAAASPAPVTPAAAPAAPAAAPVTPAAAPVTKAAAPAAAPVTKAATPAAPVAPVAAPAAAPVTKAAAPAAPATPSVFRKPAAAQADADGGASDGAGRDDRGHGRGDETVRVKTSVLNALMEMAGEMVLGRNRLLRALDGQVDRIEGLGPILHQVSAITTSMQEQVMRTRLQPLGSVFGRFRRLVRDMSAKLGKEVVLETSGEDVELDKTIIEGLADPLVHLIRNSLDHGVEVPADREKAGKSRKGTVRIEAYHEGGMVNIDVRDDGKGIDVDRVKQKAFENGLVAEADLDRLSDREAYHLIFLPGFSTAQVVTDVSGRGVGMDVVRTNIEKLGGSVDLNSTPGQGSVFSLKLPLTLAIVSSLIVQVEDQRFALPQVGLEEVIRLKVGTSKERIERVRGADVLRHRGKLLPIVRLADVLGIPRTFVESSSGDRLPDRRGLLGDRRGGVGGPAGNDDSGERRDGGDRRRSASNVQRILVLKVGRNRFGMLVDRIVDNEEIVVKPLSRFVEGSPCFSGATILGDGTIAMILDTLGVMHEAKLRFDDLAGEVREESEAEQRRKLRETVPVVLFSAGTEELFALPLGQVARIEKVKLGDIRRVSNREYLNYLGASIPLLRPDQYLPLTGMAERGESLEVIIPKHAGHALGVVCTKVIDARDVDIEVDRETIAWEGLLGTALLDGEIALLLDIHGFAALAGEGRSTIPRMLPAGPSGLPRVLLAEDTPYYRAIVEATLRRAGADVVVAEDGRVAWEYLMAEAETFDAVVTDLAMPVLDGRGLLSRIRNDERTQSLAVVAVTTGRAATNELTEGRDAFDAQVSRLDASGLVSCLAGFIQQRMAALQSRLSA